jgi:EAL domain-containing protein (putative c-di-GMP-specific phosphodiesterase class I)
VLKETATDPALLTLEVTESVFVRDDKRALVVLDELKEIGVKLALDDFGTGYSSLGYLNTLPIDTIKVDQTFIANLTDKPNSQEIVNAIIRLAHALGMTVVSEGVETSQQHFEVTRLGSDRCQGYYFAEPMLAQLVDALLLTGDGASLRLPVRR